jgi:hypothetical protein
VRIASGSLSTLTIILLVLAGCASPVRLSTGQPLASDSPAQTSATAAPTESTADNQDEIVCKSERQTGTRFKKERCRRRSDIDQQTQQARDAMKEVERKGANRSDMPSG